MRPAIRLIFAPLLRRYNKQDAGFDRHGEAQGRTIRIDPRGDQLLDTLVHEMAHVNHPDWTEEMVQKYTATRMKKDSWKRKAAILRLLGSATIEGED